MPVELFDAHGVSFISVTQAFNTTTSMGRLTLNMLLSFAQFEREITGERIRDKVAASKRKGIWMGGAVPLGYVRSPVRINRSGRRTGGVPISRGHLYWILSNPIYVGRLRHKGLIHDGLHPAIVDIETWDRVQQRLARQTQTRRAARSDDHSFLAGKLFDDRGNRMGASHASKGGRRWRYYVSRAALSGQKQEAGSVARIPAAEIEDRVARAVGTHLTGQASVIADHQINRGFLGGNVASVQREQTRSPPTDSAAENDVRNAIERVTVSATRIEIVLSESVVGDGQDRLLTLPWSRTSSRRRCEIVQGVEELKQPQRAMRTKARDGFVKALGDAHCWLDELLSDPTKSVESLAVREGKSERSIRMTLSLAFLSPVLAEAAMEGRLPRGFSARRLTDLPMLWSEQWGVLGLREPIQAQPEPSWLSTSGTLPARSTWRA